MLSLGKRIWLLDGMPHAPAARRARVEDFLAGILGGAVRLDRDARGRPLLAPPHHRHALSLSHADGLTVAALSEGGCVGVDMETLPRLTASWAEAARLLPLNERRWLDSFAHDQAPLAFGHLWCGREAVLKARGSGLAEGIEAVCFAPHLIGGRLPAEALVVTVDGMAYNVVWQCEQILDVLVLLCRAESRTAS